MKSGGGIIHRYQRWLRDRGVALDRVSIQIKEGDERGFHLVSRGVVAEAGTDLLSVPLLDVSYYRTAMFSHRSSASV
jgi:hypothetical protein